MHLSLPVRRKAEKQTCAQAAGLVTFVKKYKLVATLYILSDILSVLANLSRTLYVGARDTLVTFADDVQPLRLLNIMLKKCPDNQVNGRTYWLLVWKMSNA